MVSHFVQSGRCISPNGTIEFLNLRYGNNISANTFPPSVFSSPHQEGVVDIGYRVLQIIDVSGQVGISQTGIVRNRATAMWTTALTATNTSAAPIGSEIRVVLTNLTPGVTMLNNTGILNGRPYITIVASGSLQPGASVSTPIRFSNPGNLVINYMPVTQSVF